jgi:hypothetical protein
MTSTKGSLWWPFLLEVFDSQYVKLKTEAGRVCCFDTLNLRLSIIGNNEWPSIDIQFPVLTN